jgi:hypothetical protein
MINQLLSLKAKLASSARLEAREEREANPKEKISDALKREVVDVKIENVE